jgi:DUF1365 family protein
MHHRLHPKTHRFAYGIFMMCVDLDELDALASRSRLFRRNRRALYEFRDSDHLEIPGAAAGVKASLGAWLAEQGVELSPAAAVRLLTLPRVAGYIFNPVSFFFCERADGSPLCAVAQVGNTFGELKPYLIPPATGGETGTFRLVVPKHYYVSPFSDLEVCFDFRLRTPSGRLKIGVNDVAGDRTLLVSTLTGVSLPFTDANLLRLTLRYPLVTLRVIALIHWHALRLWLERVPWHRKAANPHLQRGVFRPHGVTAAPDIHPPEARPKPVA